jgi:ABC-type polar amino acid transport system ATPase subunit
MQVILSQNEKVRAEEVLTQAFQIEWTNTQPQLSGGGQRQRVAVARALVNKTLNYTLLPMSQQEHSKTSVETLETFQ